MNKAYYRINNGDGWENYPSDKTPLNKYNLDKGDVALDEIDNRVIMLDNTKATKVEISMLFKEVEYEKSTGIITFTRKNGATVTIDTPMEKILTGIYYNPDTENLVLPLIDGTSMEVDLSRLMKFDEFIDSDTIAFSVKSNGTVTAIVKEGSIEEKHLRPDYLADIKVEAAKAQASAGAAAESEKNAQKYEANAKASETAAGISEVNAAKSSEDSAASASAAAGSASSASASATKAEEKAGKAKESAEASKKSATASAMHSNSANLAADLAGNHSLDAQEYSRQAQRYAAQSQSYAVGGTGTREGEDEDNAKEYAMQAKESADKAHEVVGEVVTGAKGNKESFYRNGKVNFTPDDIGAALSDIVTNGDFDEITTPGLYMVRGDTANAPKKSMGGATFWGLIVLRSAASDMNVEQIAFEDGTYHMYIRYTASSGVWSGWKELINSSNYGDFITPASIRAVPYDKIWDGVFDSIRTPGIYTMPDSSSAYGAPSSDYYGLIVLNSDEPNNFVEQIAFRENSYDIYVRYLAGDDWAEWKKLALYNDAEVRGGDKAILWTDNEGGNLRLTAPTGTMWEIDAYNGNLRIFTYANDVRTGIIIDQFGQVTFPYQAVFADDVKIINSNESCRYHSFGVEFHPILSGDYYLIDVYSDPYGEENEYSYNAEYLFYPYGFSAWTSNKYHADLGEGGCPWGNAYFQTSPNITSDRNRKESIHPLEEETAVRFIMGLKPSSYKMKDGTSGRTHYGLIAQDIEELMERLGMDSKDFAGFIKSPKVIRRYKDDDGNPLKKPIEEAVDGEYEYSLRYDEFIAPIIRMVQIQQKEIEELRKENIELRVRLEKIEAALRL